MNSKQYKETFKGFNTTADDYVGGTALGGANVYAYDASDSDDTRILICAVKNGEPIGPSRIFETCDDYNAWIDDVVKKGTNGYGRHDARATRNALTYLGVA